MCSLFVQYPPAGAVCFFVVSPADHLLAVRVCNHLRMKVDKVLIHWASAKIKFAAVRLESGDAGGAASGRGGNVSL